ncbi:FAD-dependent oxidoreductase [Nonomuraea insulae]|uniref:FAD-dependent oxidoreductase n=1 Tax=Nonomuraea insulae TaxID=1616787 RepID=A0ABW1CLA7_9ACTN
MNAPVDVVVVGGGIGGLANAYALATAGHSVRVLERAPEFAEVGAGLQMAPNATRVLKDWGLLEDVLAAGVTPRRLLFKDALDGGDLTHLDLDDGFVERYGAPYVVIHRSDLLDILARACERAGVDLVADCAVHDAVTEADRAVVHSARGEHAVRLVVVADGLRSRLRAKFSDDEPICSGYVAYRGAFPIARLGRDLGPETTQNVVVHVGPGRHLVQYPLRRGEILNTVAVFRSPSYEAGAEDWGGPEELDAAFASSCPDVREGLASLWRDRRWPMYDRRPIARWTDGRLVLTGDAAHPMLQYLAQGACQAIEDARCLAAELSDPDWADALKRYEAERTARTARVQDTARLWGDMWHVDGVGRLMRNELFRRRDARDYTYVDWLYA